MILKKVKGELSAGELAEYEGITRLSLELSDDHSMLPTSNLTEIVTLFLDNNGNVFFVYSDAVYDFVRKLGLVDKVSVRRATHVEWNEDKQVWEVDAAPLFGGVRTIVASDASREIALAYEKRFVEKFLSGGSP